MIFYSSLKLDDEPDGYFAGVQTRHNGSGYANLILNMRKVGDKKVIQYGTRKTEKTDNNESS